MFNTILSKQKSNTVSTMLSLFGQTLKKPNNYLRVVRKYLLYCLENGLPISEESMRLHCKGKSPSMVTPVRKFVIFAQEQSWVFPEADPEEPKTRTAANELVLSFISDQHQLRGDDSRNNYMSALNIYFIYVEKHQMALSTRSVDSYLRSLKQKQYATHTLNFYLSVIKQFTRWVVKNRVKLELDAGQVEQVREVLNIRPYNTERTFYKDALTLEERDRLLLGTDDIKWRSIFALMALCGLRSAEVVRLTVSDVDLQNLKLWVSGKGKGTKKDVKLFSSCAGWLTHYLGEINPSPTDPLFPGLTTRAIRHKVDQSLERLNLKRPKLTTHSLRHTSAQILLEKGVDPMWVKRQLRHSRFENTEFYIAKSLEKKYHQEGPDDI